MIVLRQLWFLILCVLLGVFAPSRAVARMAETRTGVFAPEVAETWKVYGPDLDGSLGSLNGTGGLEAVVMDAEGTAKGVVSDTSGHVVATVATVGGPAVWQTTRVGAYGPLPTSRAEVLLDAARIAEATAWRGRRADETGFYWLGARYYEPTSGRFLSPDPAGHAASMSLYDYANGDPVNQFDPDGRLSVGAWSNATAQQVQKSYNDYAMGAWQGQQAVQRENERFWNETLAGQALRMVPGFSTLAAYQTGGGQAAFVDAGLNLAMLPLSFVGSSARVGVGAVGAVARVETQALVRTEVAAVSRAVQTESSAVIRSRVVANIAENQSATRNIGTGLATMESRASAAENAAPKGGLNLFRAGPDGLATREAAAGWREGDRMLHLPNKGSPAANWNQNAGRLREEMGNGQPIFDSYRDASTGLQIPVGTTPTSGGRFLNAERKLLESRGWQYSPQTGAYHPPGS